MVITSFLKKYPLFRLAVPLVAGIAVGWYCSIDVLHILLLWLFSVVALLAGLRRNAPRWLFGAGAFVFMMVAGLFVEECEEASKAQQWSGEKTVYRARLLEKPADGEATMKVLADVTMYALTGMDSVREKGRVYLYFPRSAETGLLDAGSEVLVDVTMRPFVNAGNPAEFDAEKYYYIKGVDGYAFVANDGWEYVGESGRSLLMCAMSVRESVVDMYRSLSFEGDGLALLSALTLGEKRDFPKELKESYSVAGASHVLALSGMHLGVLYLLLITLFPLRGRVRELRIVRETLVVLMLWVFAFVAGLSPSIVRAAILFTLMSVGRCLQQDSSAVSSLSFAAIVMLLFSPHLLFDLSFQLSFSAVFAILLLVPVMQSAFRINERGTVVRYLLNMFALTVAAQFGTLPFVWYTFGVFPLYFILTNLVVVPLAFVLMSLTVAVWVLALVPPVQQAVAVLLKLVVLTMNGCVNCIASLPGASLPLPGIGAGGAFLVALLLFMLAYGVVNHQRRLLYLSGCCAALSFVVMLVSGSAKEREVSLIVYNNSGNPLLHAVDGKQNYLISTVPQDSARYEYVSSSYIKREKLNDPAWVNGEYDGLFIDLNDGLLSFYGLRMRLVDNALWQGNIYVEPADVVLICHGFKGRMSDLVEAFPAACYLLDGSLYSNSRQRIQRECVALGIETVDISTIGAVMLEASGDSFTLTPLRGK